jgi:2-polyprenyl-3-methyl-5-hydroxy-6-metoxy-1,4-benzoquinol methylase
MKYKNWDEFWGEFLQVTFHAGNPELWPSRQRKADWCQKNLNLPKGAKILDLGCGDGLIDIWLSRMGFEVTAVDRSETVLNLARQSDDTHQVKFISSDLKSINFNPESFDAVLLIETSGLMSKSDDRELIAKIHKWLKPGGKFILDCPETVEEGNSWSQEFPIGKVTGKSSFDKSTRLQNIQFFFKPTSEEVFGLNDPYDLSKGNGPGIVRYLYPKSEVATILESAGFTAQEIGHYYLANYFAMMGQKN